MIRRLPAFEILWLLSVLLLAAGCAAVEQQSPPGEVRAFLGTASEANFQGMQRGSGKQLDLSGYTMLMDVRYPPTQAVEVLSSPPSRPYQAFAVLETGLPNSAETYDPQLLDSLKTKAQAIGADAVIFPAPRELAQVPGQQKSPRLAAVAVKYRVERQPAGPRRP